MPGKGGEPTLMGIDFYRRAIEYQKKYKKPAMVFEHTLQTNGTLLNDGGAGFSRNTISRSASVSTTSSIARCLPGISGPTDFRQSHARTSSAPKTWRTTISWRAVNRINADYPSGVYRFLRDEAASWMQFIPAIERMHHRRAPFSSRATVSERSVQPWQFGDFLITIFDAWVRHDVGKVFVQTFEVVGRQLAAIAFFGMWVDVRVRLGLALEHNGDLYTCDHFVEPKYLLGNIMQTHLLELVGSEPQRRFGQDKLDTLPRSSPGVRGPLRLPGGMPQKPLLHHSGRGAWIKLSMRRLQGFFPTHRPSFDHLN